MSWTIELESDLINEVARRRYLWDVTNPLFHQKNLEKKTYDQISDLLTPRWRSHAHLLSGKSIMKKFAKLKSCYIWEFRRLRDLKSGQGSVGFVSNWVHYSRMQFLEKCATTEDIYNVNLSQNRACQVINVPNTIYEVKIKTEPIEGPRLAEWLGRGTQTREVLGSIPAISSIDTFGLAQNSPRGSCATINKTNKPIEVHEVKNKPMAVHEVINTEPTKLPEVKIKTEPMVVHEVGSSTEPTELPEVEIRTEPIELPEVEILEIKTEPINVETIDISTSSESSCSSYSPAARRNRKRKRDNGGILFEATNETETRVRENTTKDSDDCYGYYIAAAMKKIIDPLKRDLARLDIQRVLIKYTHDDV